MYVCTVHILKYIWQEFGKVEYMVDSSLVTKLCTQTLAFTHPMDPKNGQSPISEMVVKVRYLSISRACFTPQERGVRVQPIKHLSEKDSSFSFVRVQNDLVRARKPAFNYLLVSAIKWRL